MIRDIRFADIPRIREIVESYHKESIYRDLKPSERRFTEFLKSQILSPTVTGWVIEINGNVEGVFIGAIEPGHYSDEPIAVDRLFVVSEKGLGRGAYLVKKFAQLADARHAKIYLTSGAVPSQTRKLKDLYSLLGLSQVGGIHTREDF